MVRMLATVLGLLALALAALGLVSRYLPISYEVVLVLAAASPYLTAAAVAAMILFGLSRRWVLTILAALLSIAMLGALLPQYLGAEKTTVTTAVVRVLSANLNLGQADPRVLVEVARESADVVVVQEMTPAAANAMSEAGLEGAFPHRMIDPRESADGIGMWSRYPIADARSISGFAMPILSARIRVPGVVIAPSVLAVHLSAPWVHPLHYFRDDMARFPATLRELAHNAGAGAVIVAGDLNATYDMQPFRRLLGEGYRDAAEQAGAGLTRSYPSGPWRLPLIGIDHVLVYNCTASSAHTVAVPGSDHRGLLTTVDIPVDPTAS